MRPFLDFAPGRIAAKVEVPTFGLRDRSDLGFRGPAKAIDGEETDTSRPSPTVESQIRQCSDGTFVCSSGSFGCREGGRPPIASGPPSYHGFTRLLCGVISSGAPRPSPSSSTFRLRFTRRSRGVPTPCPSGSGRLGPTFPRKRAPSGSSWGSNRVGGTPDLGVEPDPPVR